MAAPRCYLTGMIESTNFSGTKKNSGVTNMIRMRFEAGDSKQCEKMLSSYCRYNVLDKQYVPRTLKASFVDEAKKDSKVDFEIDKKCNITHPTNKEDE